VFNEPLSPHLAARRTGTTIDLRTVAAWVDAHPCPWLLVETAGGLLSPLAPSITNLELARTVRPDALLIVAQDRLGVLHDVTACIVALRALAPELGCIFVLQPPAESDLSTGTNASELVALGLADQVFTMPRGTPADLSIAAEMDRLLGHVRRMVGPSRGFT
jgi:dethiobiotin synthetase